MDETDLINIKWHGSTTGNLRGGQIQEDLDELHKDYDIPKNYEMEFFSKKGITEEDKRLYFFLRARAQTMYEGAQKCEQEITEIFYEKMSALQDEIEGLKEEKEELEEKLEKVREASK